MNHASADLLGFDTLLGVVERYVSSPGGLGELRNVRPVDDLEMVAEMLADTAEAMAYHSATLEAQPASRGAAIRLRFDSLPDPRPHVAKLAIEGSVLEGIEIRELVSVLDRACDVRAVLTATAAKFPRLGSRAARIAELRPLVADVAGKVDPDGTVPDHASVALARIRRDMERQQRLIQEALERFLRAHRDDGVLQEEFVAIRNERFVLPIVAGQKRRVDGIVHAASGTGHTLFIEPLEAVELNNDLVRLREQEHREVRRILADITGRLREASADLAESAQALAELDLLFAKARFADDFRCTVPRLSNRIRLQAARHPLLEDVLGRRQGRVVPLSLTLEGSRRTLLISGPNTGGKTVALKTVGLLALMTQAGLPAPAEEAEFPVFHQVLADIGDQQSIEQSLSTFSGHIARMREVLDALGPGSLVLMDELGRATDPDEGGALAVALLDHVRQSGAFALASTHLPAPKMYGATTEGVLNGAMSFDERTLQPTYQLRLGAPGASAGLDIASRLGLPESLIEKARSTLSDTQRQTADFLKLLEQKLEAAGQLERETLAAKRALESERAALGALWEKRESAKLKELERKAEAALEQFEQRGHKAIEEIASLGTQRKQVEQSQRKIAQAKREFREELEAALAAPPDPSAAPAPAVPELREGARVRLRGVREPGRVKRVMGPGTIEVEAGFLRLQVSREDVVEVLPETPEAAKLPVGVTVRTVERTHRTAGGLREINLIGRRAEEARDELDKFLDDAALAGVERVRIVHGHGMGVLKKVVAELLAASPHVGAFHAADAYEGGAGATIAELRVE